MNCPECGTQLLKRHEWFYDLDSDVRKDIGIWHEYDGDWDYGEFVCENDHEFTVDAETHENIF